MLRRPHAALAPALAIALAALAGCSSDTASSSGTTDAADAGGGGDGGGDVGAVGDGGDGGDAGDAASAVELPDLGTGWQIIEPGGDTICSRGTPYRYGVRGGTVNRVVIDFMGGGACWDEFTCGYANAIFNEDVSGLEDWLNGPFQGIYDTTNPDNPFRDWYHVFIPYCTGDVHWGDAVTTYGQGDSAVTINHKGAVNVRAVLQWVQQTFQAPDQIFVTGCSAGAYGSVMWAPHLAHMYPNADVVQFGDSGAGVITNTFFSDSFPSWNPYSAFPNWIPSLDPDQVDLLGLHLYDLYGRIADYYSTDRFAEYNTDFDSDQTFYFQAMGGTTVQEWSSQMRASVSAASAQAGNFHYYTAPGEQHCIIPYDNFYTVTSGGVRLLDWINALLANHPVDNVDCGNDCQPPQ